MGRFPTVDFTALADALGIDLTAAFSDLAAVYTDVDARNQKNTRDLDLPCRRGCSDCCHESVFLTPLEFLYVWRYVQETLSEDERDAIIDEALALYAAHQKPIDGFLEPPPEGEGDHFAIARGLRFTCPFLDGEGACRVYPARELYARLFGASFNKQGGIYGCALVGESLGGRTVTLLAAEPQARRLAELPLTHMRQVYPWFFTWLFTDDE